MSDDDAPPFGSLSRAAQTAVFRGILAEIFGQKQVDRVWSMMAPAVRHAVGHGDLPIPDEPGGPEDEWGGVWRIYDAE